MPPRRRASTPTPSSDLDPALLAAMESTSPFRPAQASKRSHGTMAGSDDDENDQSGATDTGPTGLGSSLNQNERDAIERHVDAKRLRTDQAASVFALASHRTPVHDALLSNKLAQAVPAEVEWKSTPFFEVLVCSLCPARIDCLLEANTSAAALAIFLSSKTNVYKGEGPTKMLMKIIAIKGWGVTETTLKNKHSRKRIKARAQYQLTQARSKIQKAIVTSLKHGAVLNILDLTSLIASKGDDVIVNEVLCARIALMRAVYEEHPHDDFWDFLDVRIETISKAAGGDSAKIVRAFHFALTTDQKKYDTEDVYEIDKSGGSAARFFHVSQCWRCSAFRPRNLRFLKFTFSETHFLHKKVEFTGITLKSKKSETNPRRRSTRDSYFRAGTKKLALGQKMVQHRAQHSVPPRRSTNFGSGTAVEKVSDQTHVLITSTCIALSDTAVERVPNQTHILIAPRLSVVLQWRVSDQTHFLIEKCIHTGLEKLDFNISEPFVHFLSYTTGTCTSKEVSIYSKRDHTPAPISGSGGSLNGVGNKDINLRHFNVEDLPFLLNIGNMDYYLKGIPLHNIN
ncbi:hypothetical protein B0H14DRAFT_3688507 [Mycena olivaceomarginata]|nr:hypothetical protein B0H14DRAFT_3688507 [Mycena olivaceomarginata]